jgi:DNA-binding FadR family transcriptional regulator
MSLRQDYYPFMVLQAESPYPAAEPSEGANVAERVAASLREEIADGEWPVDTMLPAEHQLMKRFCISRPSCREALRILQSEGLVKVERGSRGGARVTLPDAERIADYSAVFLQMRNATISEVFETRVVIEAAAVVALTRRRSPEILSQLAQNVASQRYLLHDRPAFYRRNREFRHILIENCGSESLRMMGLVIGGIADRQLSKISIQLPAAADQEEQFLEATHMKERMIRAIERGDSEAAADMWRAYLRGYLDSLREIVPDLRCQVPV